MGWVVGLQEAAATGVGRVDRNLHNQLPSRKWHSWNPLHHHRKAHRRETGKCCHSGRQDTVAEGTEEVGEKEVGLVAAQQVETAAKAE